MNTTANLNLNSDIFGLYEHRGSMNLYHSPSVALKFTLSRTFDLMKGSWRDGGVQELRELMSAHSISEGKSDETLVFIPYYELGHYFEGTRSLAEETILGYWLIFQKKDPYVFESPKAFETELTPPSLEKYRESFRKGREHLLRGDCYQYNLTFPAEIKIDTDFENFLQMWGNDEKRSSYANITSLGPFEKNVLMSNSPECLFDIEAEGELCKLHTRPIKGTVAYGDEKKKTQEQAWDELKNSEKNESELYMITDLLRNDLTRIGEYYSQVVHLKEKLVVPGLVHSYSHIAVDLKKETTLYDVMKGVFPGGSITGAPKKRVMQILDELEGVPRGFYCGSTVIHDRDFFKASINIRSGIFDRESSVLHYHAGGGITLQSDEMSEYHELLDKISSFQDFLSI